MVPIGTIGTKRVRRRQRRWGAPMMADVAEDKAVAVDRVLLHSLDEWINRARSALLGFWRDSHCDFWRDTHEIARFGKKSRKRRYYPSATFMCVRALLGPMIEAGERLDVLASFNLPRFVGKLKSLGVDDVIKRSAVALEEWNPFTAASCLEAMLAAREALRLHPSRTQSLSRSRRETLLQWLDCAVAKQRDRLSKHLRGNVGGTLAGKEACHPFLTAEIVNAIRAARPGPGSQRVPGQKRVQEKARQNAEAAIAAHAAGSSAPGDLIAATYSASLLILLNADEHAELAECCVNLLCDSQVDSGGWPLGRSLLYSPSGQGVQVSSYSIGAELSRMSLHLLGQLAGSPAAIILRDQALRRLFRRAISTYSSVTVDTQRLAGWYNDHTYGMSVIESWTTANVLEFLVAYRQYVRARLHTIAVERLGGIQPHQMEGWLDWRRLHEPARRGREVLKFISRRFIECRCSWDGVTSLGGGDRSGDVSMVLYGPPGTGKTSIVRAIAKRLHWPLITITPSVFLADGREGIDLHARRVFAELMALDGAVVLFDECDELFRKRPRHTDESNTGMVPDLSAAALITGAMLPRLQDLRHRGRVIFVIATNRLAAIDSAVLRRGRVDQLIAVGPPELGSRRRLIKESWEGIPDAYLRELARRTEKLTRAEVLEVAERVRGLRETPPLSLTADGIEGLVERLLPPETRAIDEADWQDYVAELPRSGPERDAVK